MDDFSSGGSSPRWTARGKTWGSMAHVKAHLQNVRLHTWVVNHADYSQAEIVEYMVSEVSASPVSVVQQEVKDAWAEKRRKEQEAVQRAREESEREQLRLLQQKYPNG